jgi:uncharacterized protein with PIN domain
MGVMEPLLFRFHGDLNDFLPKVQRHSAIAYPLDGADGAPVAVKHPIESLGVPHPEVEQIVVHNAAGAASVDFAYYLQPGDGVDVYPLGCVVATPAPLPLRPPLPRPARFILDTHLGQLAAYLRLFGFDTLYRNDYDDATLAELAAAEDRVLLSRDRGLLKRKRVVYGHCVRAHTPATQIVDILRRYRLQDGFRLWQRCLRCNGMLAPVPKAAVLDRLEPKTKRYYDEFQQCAGCGQVYWHGSHSDRMARFVAEVLAALAAPPMPCV